MTLSFSFSFSQKPWKPLFNGKDLSSWEKVGDTAPFDLIDDKIVMHQKANTREHSFLRTKKKYRNFILEFDAKRDASFYYGVLFRAQNAPDTAHVRLYGYQVKVDHLKTRQWTGAIFDDFGNTWSWINTLENNPTAQKALLNPGEWDHFRIEAIDDHIKVWLNEVVTSDIKNSKYKAGFIALKIHFLGDKKEMEIHKAEFKNIRIIDQNAEKHALSTK
jgi:hypothetical protein